MNNSDKLQRFLFEHSPVRGQFVHLDHAYQTIITQHEYPPVISKLLGEALVLITLLAGTIKFKGRISIQFQGQDKLKLLLVQCNDEFHIRGLVQWEGELDSAAIMQDLKKGVIVITVDPEKGGQRYQGMVNWQGNSLAESIEGYFRDSEQLNTRIWLAVNETRATGMLLQMMPGTDKEHREFTKDDVLDWEHIVHLAETIKSEELLTLENEVLLHRLYHEEDIRLFESVPVMFQCTCSRKRGEIAIFMLGQEEAEEELAGKQVIIVTCDFCNKKYSFDQVDVANIFKQGSGMPPTSNQVH